MSIPKIVQKLIDDAGGFCVVGDDLAELIREAAERIA